MIGRWWEGDGWPSLAARSLLAAGLVVLIAHWMAGCYVARVARLIGKSTGATIVHVRAIARGGGVIHVGRNTASLAALVLCWGQLAGCSAADTTQAGLLPSSGTRSGQPVADAGRAALAADSGGGWLDARAEFEDAIAAVDVAELADVAPPVPDALPPDATAACVLAGWGPACPNSETLVKGIEGDDCGAWAVPGGKGPGPASCSVCRVRHVPGAPLEPLPLLPPNGCARTVTGDSTNAYGWCVHSCDECAACGRTAVTP